MGRIQVGGVRRTVGQRAGSGLVGGGVNTTLEPVGQPPEGKDHNGPEEDAEPEVVRELVERWQRW